MKESFLGVVLPLEAARAKACRVIGSCSELPLLPPASCAGNRAEGKPSLACFTLLVTTLGIGVLQQVWCVNALAASQFQSKFNSSAH